MEKASCICPFEQFILQIVLSAHFSVKWSYITFLESLNYSKELPAIVFKNIRYSKFDISRRCHFWVMLEFRINWRGDIMDARLKYPIELHYKIDKENQFKKQMRAKKKKKGVEIRIVYLVCGMPYLIPTPTRGNALMTLFTVLWSANENMMDAETKRWLSFLDKCDKSNKIQNVNFHTYEVFCFVN